MTLVRQRPRTSLVFGALAVYLRPEDRVCFSCFMPDATASHPAITGTPQHRHPLHRDPTVQVWFRRLGHRRFGLICSRDLLSHARRLARGRPILDLGLYVSARRLLAARLPRGVRFSLLGRQVLVPVSAFLARVPRDQPDRILPVVLLAVLALSGLTALGSQDRSEATGAVILQLTRAANIEAPHGEAGDAQGHIAQFQGNDSDQHPADLFRPESVPGQSTSSAAPSTAVPDAGPALRGSLVAVMRDSGAVQDCYVRLADGLVRRAQCTPGTETAILPGGIRVLLDQQSGEKSP